MSAQQYVEGLEQRIKQLTAERDYLVREYERATGCGPQGFIHAAGHIYNAITNAQCDANTDHIIALQSERDALVAHLGRFKELCRRGTTEDAGWMTNSHVVREFAEICQDTPETSLAKLIALKQAEALDHEAELFERDICDSVDEKFMYRRATRTLRESASDLREQAGGDV